jgi:hypothetical protein
VAWSVLLSPVVNETAQFAFHVRCVACQAVVTLHFKQWPEQSDNEVQPLEWSCPYCKALNIGAFPGRFIRALPWYDPEPLS